MELRQFGKTGMAITPVGFGAWAIGGEWKYGWGTQADDESIAAIHRALDLGINWIDTAPAYGLGRSEAVIARALKGMTEKPYIFTKCSLVWDPDDPNANDVSNRLKADSIRREVEDSLRRLEVETIDLYQIHWPNPEADIEEGWQTLVELKQSGKVQHIGLSNFSVEQMERVKQYGDIETLQPPYSLLVRSTEEEILPYCAENNIGTIVYSPMYSGLLTGKMSKERVANLHETDWRRRDSNFQEPKLTRNLKLADLLSEIGMRHGVSAAEVSIAWTLRLESVTAAIVGARRPSQVEGIIGAATFRLSEDELKEIDDFLADNPV